MSIRNSTLKAILIASGGPDMITNRNDYLDHIGLVLGVDITELQSRNEKLEAILGAYINPPTVHGDFSSEFTSEFI